MKFKIISEKGINDCGSIKEPHIVISINDKPSEDNKFTLTNYCLDILNLYFEDIEDITITDTFFTKDDAKEILNFVEKYCSQIDLVVVQCKAGLSRSVAVGSALSKIINFTDDNYFSKGIPNMLVYLTLLDTYFTTSDAKDIWSSIFFKRQLSLKAKLSPAIFRIWLNKVTKGKVYG